jgi:CBS domain-containing protein
MRMKTVKDVMSTLPVWVSETASFREIAARLRECRVSAFPVLDAHGKVASWRCATVSSTRLLPAPAGSALTSEVAPPGRSSRQPRAFGSAGGPAAWVAWIEAV